MPQVSRRPLAKELEAKVFRSLIEALKLLTKDRDLEIFLQDILTSTERKMIAKRLAIAILLKKGASYSSIKAKLNVTQTTISQVVRVFEFSSGYRNVIGKLEQSEAIRDFWKDIESTLYRFSSPGKVFMEEEAVKTKLKHKKKTLV